MELNLNVLDILQTPVDFLMKYYKDGGHIKNAQREFPPSGEPYKLLTYLSHQFNNTTIIDAGTYQGVSALCLANNPTNKVLSYDIHSFGKDALNFDIQERSFSDVPNVEFRQLDVNLIDKEILKSSPLIYLDIDPHDSIQEDKFLKTLQEIGYEGFLLCDDIRMDKLCDWYNALTIPKYNLTSVGHLTGTGLFPFGESKVIFSL